MTKETEKTITSFEKIYNNFLTRIKPESWLEILNDESCVNNDNKSEINYKLIDFLTNNSNIPAKIYECLGDFFEWNEHRSEIAEIFPLSVVNDLCDNMYSDHNIKYDILPTNLGKKTDTFINLYSSANDKLTYEQVYKTQKDIEMANDIYSDYLPLKLLEVACMRSKYDHANALSKIEYIKLNHEPNEDIYLNEGSIYLVMGRLDEAYRSFKQGFNIRSDYFALNTKLGQCCMNLGYYEEARQIYMNLSYSHPYIDDISTNYVSANCFIVDMYESKPNLSYDEFLSLSESYLYVSRVEDAYNTVCLIKDVIADDTKGCLVIGHILRNMEKFDEALSFYEKATIADPTSCFGYYFLAKTYSAMGQIENAMKNYEKSIELNEDYYLPYYPLAKICVHEGQFEKATKLLAVLNKQNFDIANVYFLNGLIAQKKDSYENALIFYDKSIDLQSSNLIAYINKSVVLRALERYREAMASCNQALDYGFKDSLLYTEKGLIYKASEMYEDALYWFDISIDEENPYAELYFLKGICLYQTEQSDEANECFDKAISMDKSYEQQIKEAIDEIDKINKKELVDKE